MGSKRNYSELPHLTCPTILNDSKKIEFLLVLWPLHYKFYKPLASIARSLVDL